MRIISFILTFICIVFFSKTFAQNRDTISDEVARPIKIKLWQKVNGDGLKIPYYQKRNNILIYLPNSNRAKKETSNRASDKRTAIIVAPGGSYYYLAIASEGKAVGQFFASKGIVAIVMRYSIGFFGAKYPAQIEDYRRCVDYIKSNSEKYNIDTNKIGIIGFSAGGHLAGCASLEWNPHYRPAFAAMIYPVITMSKPYAHKDSKKYLIRNNPHLAHNLSLEERVSPYLPPQFIIHCEDDNVVDVKGTKAYSDSLYAHFPLDTFIGLPDNSQQDIDYSKKYFINILKTGGHGFGVKPSPGSDAIDWTNCFLNWLSSQSFN